MSRFITDEQLKDFIRDVLQEEPRRKETALRLSDAIAADPGEGPHQRYTVKIVITAHEWDHALRFLDEFVAEINDHGETCGLVSGGRGYIHIEVDPTQTKEQYDKELERWFKKRCDQRDAAAAKIKEG